MKKILLIVFGSVIALTGCSKADPQVTNANSDLVEVDSVQKILSASDVEDTEAYEFAISNNLIDGINTFKLTDKLVITAENDLEYTLTYSVKENFEDASKTTFQGEYKTQPKEGYYRVEADGNMDLKISTM